jgi:DNA-binding NtrC family response regulator
MITWQDRVRAISAAGRRPSVTHPHILVVDDEHIILDVLEGGLSDTGFRISRADTSDVALEIFEHEDIDLLMSDIKMPGPVDGVTLAGLMRRKNPQLPVIFLSGNLDGLANSGRLDSPSAFLIKPVNLSDVMNTVGQLMSDEHDPADVIHNRASSGNHRISEWPAGTPTSDRHAMETAHSPEDEEKPPRKPVQPA